VAYACPSPSNDYGYGSEKYEHAVTDTPGWRRRRRGFTKHRELCRQFRVVCRGEKNCYGWRRRRRGSTKHRELCVVWWGEKNSR